MSQQEEYIRGLEEQCSLLQRKINALRSDRIIAVDTAAKFKIEEDLRVAEVQLEEAKAALEKALGSASNQPAPAREDAAHLLHDWHRYTCDRMVQNNQFHKILMKKAEVPAHFFYIYGLDRHAHEALVARFAYDLEGVLKSHLNAELTARCRVDRADIISLTLNPDIGMYKADILSSLFIEFGLDPDAHAPLLERNLEYLWKQSPRLQALCKEDQVCCYMVIPEFDWDSEITPEVVTWLITEFCGGQLPDEAPTFFFFFGVEFEEENSPVKEEVEAAIRVGGRIQILPELNKVEERDLKRWFSTYRKFMPDTQQRSELYQKYFGEQPTPYMEDVVQQLERIINELNHPE
jgi:hypothetical protein